MLATVPTLRRPALRRSEDANALFATDLPLLADAADFCRLAEKHGWRTWIHGGWLLLDKLPNPPDMPTKIPDAPGELGCCLSLLARHPDDTADGTLLRALLKSADAGDQAMEKYCRMLHRDLAARLRTHNPLPGRLLPYLCRAQRKDGKSMIISCMGHAKFVIELDNGLRIVTDPYDASCGYPVTANPADVVLVSHQHHDHNAVETIPGNPRVIDRAGDFDLGGGAAVRAIEAYHDEQQGKLRGKTLLFCLKAEGLTVMHLGDLGHMLTTEQRLLLGSADIVMLPVGGYYTMDANMAKQVADVLHARVILPMHYKTEANASWPIAPVADFLRLYPEKAEELPLLRVSAGDLSCQPHLVVLMPLSLGNVKA